MTTSTSARTHCLIVFLVLLIHSLFLFLLLLDCRLIPTIPLQQAETPEITQQDESWAEMKAQASHFADIVFYNESACAPPLLAAEQTTESSQEQSLSDDETNVDHQETPSLLLAEYEDIKNELSIEAETNETHQPEQKKKTVPIVKKGAPKQAAKRTLTLADITRGFLDQARNDGAYSLAMAGEKGKQPPDKQIIYQRFLEKLHWQLQNSFKIHKHSLSLYSSVKGIVEITVSLNTDSTIKQLMLVRSCGNTTLDQFLLFIFKDASGSFPVLPSSMPEALRIFSLIINVDIPRLTNGGSGLTFSLI